MEKGKEGNPRKFKNMRSITKWTAAAIVAVMAMTTNGVSKETPRTAAIAVDDANVYWSPYVWKKTGAGQTARVEATMPGAYVKLDFRGSDSVRLLVDGTANNGCPAAAMPVIDYSLDNGAFQSVRLVKTGEVYSLLLGEKQDRAKEHRLEVFFRSPRSGRNAGELRRCICGSQGSSWTRGARYLACPVRAEAGDRLWRFDLRGRLRRKVVALL